MHLLIQLVSLYFNLVMRMKLKDKMIFTLYEPDGKLNIFKLAYPVILQELFNYMITGVHTLILSDVSKEAVAAVGVANTLINIMTVFANCVSVGVMILMSFALGRDERNTARSLFTSGIVTAIVLALITGGAVTVLAPHILKLYSLDGITLTYATGYLRIRMLFLFTVALSTVFVTVLRCFGKTLIIMISGIASNILNALFSFWAVGSPLFGDKVSALAFAAVIGQTFSAIIAGIAALKRLKPAPKTDIKSALRILKLGIPSVYGNLSYQISVTVTTAFISAIGIAAVNTRVYVNNITMYVPLIPSALSQANSVMLGRLLGRCEFGKARRLVRQNTLIAAVSSTLISATVFIFSKPLISVFTSDPDIIRTAQTILLIDIVIELMRSANYIYNNSTLICAKDVYFASFMGMACSWIISVGGSFLLCNVYGLGIVGCYIAFAADEGTRAILAILRWKYGPWEKRLKNGVT